MIIPLESIDEETLQNLVESFVLREGTDYGEVEISLQEKVDQIIEQLRAGDIVIEYSEEHESINIIQKP
ncbi:YheU family protein [Glaciecola sp. MF2-115]|uniref:YheU family protein n=1 Tax=Glaciecola sp. MF2-115 TaxID=3384827 RepID=UPI0039A35760